VRSIRWGLGCCYACSVRDLSVRLLVTSVSPAESDEPIEMPFMVWFHGVKEPRSRRGLAGTDCFRLMLGHSQPHSIPSRSSDAVLAASTVSTCFAVQSTDDFPVLAVELFCIVHSSGRVELLACCVACDVEKL